MIGHFSAEELASYRAGAIDPDRAARISAHLADCARCGGVDSDLAGVSALLASVPAPPMPDRLTERVQAAIAAEAEQRAAGLNSVLVGQTEASPVNPAVGLDEGRAGVPAQTGRPPSTNIPGRPDLPNRSRRRRTGSRRSVWTSPLVLGGLAVTGVLAFVVISASIALSHAQLGPASGSQSHRAAAKAPAPGAFPRPDTRQPSGTGGVSNPLNSEPGASVKYSGAAGRSTTVHAFDSPARYTQRNIVRGVRSIVANSATFGVESGPVQPGHSQSQPRKVGSVSVTQIAGCLSAVAVSNGVLVVEIAHYQGKPAMVIVGKLADNAYPVTVTGLACSASRPDVLARITVPKTR